MLRLVPPPAPAPLDLSRALETLDWDDVYNQTLRYALFRLGPNQRPLAEDITQQAIANLLDKDYKRWNPARETAYHHLRDVVLGLVKNHWKKHSTKREVLCMFAEDEDPNDKDDRGPAYQIRSPISLERDVTAGQLAKAILDRAAAHFSGEDVVCAVIACFRRGVLERSAQVAELGLSDEAIRNARKRIARYAGEVREELEHCHVES